MVMGRHTYMDGHIDGHKLDKLPITADRASEDNANKLPCPNGHRYFVC